jgi:hypothetical protein
MKREIGTIKGAFADKAELLTQVSSELKRVTDDRVSLFVEDEKLFVEGEEDVVNAARFWYSGFISGMNFQCSQVSEEKLAQRLQDLLKGNLN